MFEDWHDFFLITGGAAGALVGLLFVAATLTVRVEREKALRAAGIFMTPNIYHLSTALVLSAVATAPEPTGRFVAAIAGVLALAGVAASLPAMMTLRRGKVAAHWSDFWWYGVGPAVAHGALGAAALAIAVWGPPAAGLFATAVMGLILLAIRNAWDLVTWMSATAKPADS